MANNHSGASEELLPRSKTIKIGGQDFTLREMAAGAADRYEAAKMLAAIEYRKVIREGIRPLDLAAVRRQVAEAGCDASLQDNEWFDRAQALLVRDEITAEEVLRARSAGDQVLEERYDQLFLWVLFGLDPDADDVDANAEKSEKAISFVQQHVTAYTVRKRIMEIQDELNAMEERKNVALPAVG